MKEELKTDVRFLKGIGEKKAQALNRLGVFTVADLLYFFPRAYEDRKNVFMFSDAPENINCGVKAVVCSVSKPVRISGGRLLTRIKVTDGVSDCDITFFNNPYAAKNIIRGQEYIFYGRVKKINLITFEMLSPVYESAVTGQYIHPVYPGNSGINSKATAKAVKYALENYSAYLEETLPSEQIKKYRLLGIKEALYSIHFPGSDEDITKARRRLIYEELLTLELGILSSGTAEREATAFSMKRDFTEEFISSLPYKLTGAQDRAIRECSADMAMKVPMRRLLQGDVGSGKTAVAAALMYNAVKNGFQCVLMVPTEVLAVQHKNTFDNFFRDKNINTVLLTGSTTAKNKRLIKEDIASGRAQVVIGTHAVITDDTVFNNLALCVTDEQHRFGVNQRAKIREKGINPHVLVMSATPIPRSLSLVIYGDLDISVLDEKPAGRKEIKTFRVNSAYHERLYNFIKKQVNSGHQCYIVCPLAEENEEINDRLSAEEYYTLLSEKVFPGMKTALLHGKMKQAQKDSIMQDFKNGDTDILICTVVIEVGIDVPNANIIVIENAECFGLAQIHQLRGRVGRGNTESWCILVSDKKTDEANKRFDIMCSTDDGFKIAEEDLKMRGPGDFFGSRQSGLPEMKIASLLTDSKILYAARQEAERILENDPFLTKKENRLLKEKTANLFTDIS